MADGYDVIVLDNLSTGREENLAHPRDNPRLCFYRVDEAAGGASASCSPSRHRP